MSFDECLSIIESKGFHFHTLIKLEKTFWAAIYKKVPVSDNMATRMFHFEHESWYGAMIGVVAKAEIELVRYPDRAYVPNKISAPLVDIDI